MIIFFISHKNQILFDMLFNRVDIFLAWNKVMLNKLSLGFCFWYVGGDPAVSQGSIPGMWTDFLEGIPFTGILCTALIQGEGLCPASSWCARPCWLPKKGLAPLWGSSRMGRWVGEGKRREKNWGWYVKIKVNFW